jgi:hypothetical protein
VAARSAKPKSMAAWQISRISGKGALHIGQVDAPDAESAIRSAIRKYDITDPEDQRRVAARRIVSAE